MLNVNDRDILHEINMSKISGFYVPTPFYELDAEEEAITTTVRKWMKELNAPMIYKPVEELEDFVARLNAFIVSGPPVEAAKVRVEVEMPCAEELNYLIEFSGNILMHVNLLDEYLGNGDYCMEGGIPGLLINNDVQYDEVVKLVDFFKSLDAYFISNDV